MPRSKPRSHHRRTGILITLAGLLGAATPAAPDSTAPPPEMASLVALPPRPAGAPAQEDIALSSRWPRPINTRDPNNTFKALDAFHAVRLDWCYPGENRDFIRQARERGVPVFGSINAELPDEPGGSTRVLGRDRNLDGKPIGNPELAQFVARGDVADDAFRGVVLAHCTAMLDAGVDGIFVDDPGMTYHGALHANAGYGPASLAKFRDYLKEQTTLADQDAWGLPGDLDTLDYRAFAVEKGRDLAPGLRDAFLAFHLASLNGFYEWLRAALDAHAGRRVPLACNNGSNQIQEDWHVRHFDFWLGETGLAYGDPTPRGIFTKTRNAEQLGRVQLFSPPNDGLDRLPDRAGYVTLTRRIIATSYACGSLTLVPWDVWRRGPDTPRFFGTREEFGDLYDLIDAHPDLFAGRALAYATGPDMEPWSVDGLDYVPIQVSDGEFAAIRAVPGDADAPIVVHLVDWRDTPAPTVVGIHDTLLAGRQVHLWVAGEPVAPLEAGMPIDQYVRFTLPPLRPWAILIIGNH
jgi:hypothetical protein